MVRARPDVAVGERPEGDDRQPVAPDGPAGVLRQEIVEHPEKPACQQKTDRVMAVPPLHDGVLGAGEQRVGLRDRHGYGKTVDDVQHGDDDDERAIEPVGDVDRLDPAFRDGAEEDDGETHPDHGDGDVEGPLQFGVLLAAGPSREERYAAAQHADLPGETAEPGESRSEQRHMACALHAVERGAHQCRDAEAEDHRVGVQRSQSAERQPFLAEVELRPHEFRRDMDAGRHAEERPDDGEDDQRRNDPVSIGFPDGFPGGTGRRHVGSGRHAQTPIEGPIPPAHNATVRPSRVTVPTSRYATSDDAISMPRSGPVPSAMGSPLYNR